MTDDIIMEKAETKRQLEHVEMLQLQLTISNLNGSKAQLELCKRDCAMLEKAVAENEKNYQQFSQALTQKYNIDPTKEIVNNEGVIVTVTQPEQPAQ